MFLVRLMFPRSHHHKFWIHYPVHVGHAPATGHCEPQQGSRVNCLVWVKRVDHLRSARSTPTYIKNDNFIKERIPL